MCSQATTPQAAPTQGAAPTAAEQARSLARQLQVQAAQPPRRRCYYLAPALSPEQAQFEPATDPARWQGFI